MNPSTGGSHDRLSGDTSAEPSGNKRQRHREKLRMLAQHRGESARQGSGARDDVAECRGKDQRRPPGPLFPRCSGAVFPHQARLRVHPQGDGQKRCDAHAPVAGVLREVPNKRRHSPHVLPVLPVLPEIRTERGSHHETGPQTWRKRRSGLGGAKGPLA